MENNDDPKSTRREALEKVADGLSLFTVAGLALGFKNARREAQQREYAAETAAALKRTLASVQAPLAATELKLETLDISRVVPESQRTAQDVLMTIPYIPGDTDGWRYVFDHDFGPLIEALPRYARLHIAAQDTLTPADEAHLKERYGRDVSLYPFFNSGSGGLYAQDVGEALGTVTPKGQFEIATPRSDLEDARALYDRNPFPPMPKEGITPHLLDSALAAKYPARFKVRALDAHFMGGNKSFGLLPDSKTPCVFLNKTDFVTFMHYIMGINPLVPTTRAKYEEAKARYKKAYGTENIIVLDEEDFLERIEKLPLYEAARAGTSQYFHSDMLCMQHFAQGKPIMAVTSLDETARALHVDPYSFDREAYAHTRRVEEQLHTLGYPMIRIPSLIADFNFVNAVPFRHKDTGESHVIMPVYHYPEEERGLQYVDEVLLNDMFRRLADWAEDNYTNAGIQVTRASHQRSNRRLAKERTSGSPFFGSGMTIKSGSTGGLHCKTMLLR